ncbi:MAG: methionine--tRNA ligase [Pyrinomonadaceae bacterium]
MKKFYITTPIYYVNSFPHLGHLYSTTIVDVIKRFKQQRKYETLFLTGTDEHGINIERAAANAVRTPKEQADYIVGFFKEMLAGFGLDTEHGGHDIFMRTTEPILYQGVSEFWRVVAKSKTPRGRDSIYKGHYEGWFCAACAAYKTEDEYIKPERPGDPPKCLVHEVPLDSVSEESYFFRLSDYDEALLKLYESRPDFIKPEARRNEVISFVRGGLQDLSISRLRSSVGWGIPVPEDPAQTIYVWFDALTNYITAIGYGNEEREKMFGFNKFWPAMHLVGKDILRFHAVYWPAFLMAAGLEQPVMIFAHGMWLDRAGRRMSKTLGNAIELGVLREHFPTDSIRYFLLREMVFGQDGKFSYDALIDRTNSDLAGGLGNLVSRTLAMIQKYCDSIVPSPHINEENYILAKRAGIDADAGGYVSFLEHARDQFIKNFEEFAFSRAIEGIWNVIARADKMISDSKPWVLAKEAVSQSSQAQILNAVLYRAAETLRWLACILYPAMPVATKAIWELLGCTDDLSRLDPAELKWGDLVEGSRIGEPKAVFPRLDKKKIMMEIEDKVVAESKITIDSKSDSQIPELAMVGQTAGQTTAPESTVETNNLIDITDFSKVELRAGQVLSAERIPKADKLLRLMVDLGEVNPRQILAGIAEYYEPEKLIGKKIVIVANLKPRKLRGFESHGMILAASLGEEERPVLASFSEDVPNGARLR